MAKPEWGTKRRCTSCGAAFYDFRKDPIICPRCEAVHQPEQILKPRRPRPDDKPVAPKPVPAEVAELEPAEGEETEGGFIEDVSELGEDEDDVVEVVEADEEADTDDR